MRTGPARTFGITACGALLVALALCSCAPPASSFDGERAYGLLEEIVAIGPRVAGTDQSAQTRAIIRRELEAAGLRVEEHAFEAATPLGPRNMVNMMAVVEGTRPGAIILGNHYDTKYFPDFEFVGANDGGSSTAWMIEMARALGPAREGYSVWLCWFDGEEAFVKWSPGDRLYGSFEMVRRLREEDRLSEVRAMINVDMIGDCELNVWKDRDAPEWMTKITWQAAHELGYGKQFEPVSKVTEDDHYPFRGAGIPAMEMIDFRYGGGLAQHDMNWHTVRDRRDLVCAESLKIVGDVVLEALPRLDQARYEMEIQEDALGD